MSARLSALVISDGRRGIENQALGLAEALSALRPLTLATQHIHNSKNFAKLPPRLQLALRSKPAQYGIDTPADILIGCGRQAIAPLIAAKRSSGPDVFTIYVQDPKISPRAFDLVVAPEHDGLSGDNVLPMIGSPNRVADEKLSAARVQFGQKLSEFPAPRTAVLIGGPSGRWRVTQKQMAAWYDALEQSRADGHSLMISTSRRTPDYVVRMLEQYAYSHEQVWLYDGQGDNPYFAFLAGADRVLVTEDSTNMLTEACATGKPVYRLPMAGKPGKFEALFDQLKQHYGVISFAPDQSYTPPAPLSETSRIAGLVWTRFDALDQSRQGA